MRGIHPTRYYLYETGRWKAVDKAVTEEGQVCLFVNGQELATVMCTPRDLDELALGFLRSENIIQSRDDVEVLTVTEAETCVDVWLKPSVPYTPPQRRIITSGCGGGLTFDDLQASRPPLDAHTTVTPDQVFARLRELYRAVPLYEATQGIHAAAFADDARLVLVAEDIGRHNAVDRLWGKALKLGQPTAGLMLFSTGRISSEMLNKAARMGAPIVVSRTSPTSLSVKLAQAWNVTVIGYSRRNTLRVYSGAERVVAPALLGLSEAGG